MFLSDALTEAMTVAFSPPPPGRDPSPSFGDTFLPSFLSLSVLQGFSSPAKTREHVGQLFAVSSCLFGPFTYRSVN